MLSCGTLYPAIRKIEFGFQPANHEGSLTKPIHPFPARMAPGLALDSLSSLKLGSVVLDPMSGSGTVVRQASDLGLHSHGFDLDPLAVLMSNVWTEPVDDQEIQRVYDDLLARASFSADWSQLPWLTSDHESQAFISFWFDDPQLENLMRLSAGLHSLQTEASTQSEIAAVNVLRLNLSRIIVTKEQAASLARDTSHSRPHRVVRSKPYDVFKGYERSLTAIRRRLIDSPPKGNAVVRLGDARCMSGIADQSVDAVVTSPPYLNAIDYLRGHRLALVWLGWTISELRKVRSNSIGAERAMDSGLKSNEMDAIVNAMVSSSDLSGRHMNMIHRYAKDLWSLLSEVARVLKCDGKATFVVGNSCLTGVFVKNAEGVAMAAHLLGLAEKERSERDLPEGNRYLPVTGTSLAKRMRTETVLTFARG